MIIILRFETLVLTFAIVSFKILIKMLMLFCSVTYYCLNPLLFYTS